jgi:transcriptional regulator with XRE-family HTH domain
MSLDAGEEQLNSEVDEPGWEVDPDDEWGLAVLATVGRQLKLRREAAGMRVADFAVAVGYGEDLVYKIEGGKRIPRPEYLDKSEEVLRADGLISAMKEDVEKVRYPKKVRAWRSGGQGGRDRGLRGLSHRRPVADTGTRAEPCSRRPSRRTRRRVERSVAARWRGSRSSSDPGPIDQLRAGRGDATPTRGRHNGVASAARTPAGGGGLRNVTLQVMPTDSGAHPGLSGKIEVLKFADGTAVGRSDGAFNGRPTSELKQLRILELRYSTIRAQALTPRESLAFIEHLLGET